jgi:hypothetical protein
VIVGVSRGSEVEVVALETILATFWVRVRVFSPRDERNSILAFSSWVMYWLSYRVS